MHIVSDAHMRIIKAIFTVYLAQPADIKVN